MLVLLQYFIIFLLYNGQIVDTDDDYCRKSEDKKQDNNDKERK